MSHEMMTWIGLISTQALWVALPLLPAILIYKLFPSTSVVVHGPLAGLTVKATGAFAAYLVVFASTYWVASQALYTIGSYQKPYWTINARIALQDKGESDAKADRLLDTLVVQTKPEPYYTAANYVHMFVPEGDDLPYLVFTVPKFGKQTYNLRKERSHISIDNFNKIIEITDPIIISRSDLDSDQSP